MRARPWARWKGVIGALLVTVAVSTTKAEEKPWSRAYRGELYPIIQVLGSDTTSFFGGGLSMETEVTPAFGAGMGLNWNDHLNLNTELLVGRMNTMGSIPSVPGTNVDLDLTAWLWNINLDYNILKSRLTPLVTGGVGFIMLDNTARTSMKLIFRTILALGAAGILPTASRCVSFTGRPGRNWKMRMTPPSLVVWPQT